MLHDFYDDLDAVNVPSGSWCPHAEGWDWRERAAGIRYVRIGTVPGWVTGWDRTVRESLGPDVLWQLAAGNQVTVHDFDPDGSGRPGDTAACRLAVPVLRGVIERAWEVPVTRPAGEVTGFFVGAVFGALEPETLAFLAAWRAERAAWQRSRDAVMPVRLESCSGLW